MGVSDDWQDIFRCNFCNAVCKGEEWKTIAECPKGDTQDGHGYVLHDWRDMSRREVYEYARKDERARVLEQVRHALTFCSCVTCRDSVRTLAADSGGEK